MAAYRPLFTSTGLIWLDCYLTIAIKQMVRFEKRMHLEKNQLDQIQNGRLTAIIHFHMADIW